MTLHEATAILRVLFPGIAPEHSAEVVVALQRVDTFAADTNTPARTTGQHLSHPLEPALVVLGPDHDQVIRHHHYMAAPDNLNGFVDYLNAAYNAARDGDAHRLPACDPINCGFYSEERYSWSFHYGWTGEYTARLYDIEECRSRDPRDIIAWIDVHLASFSHDDEVEAVPFTYDDDPRHYRCGL
jgi:hypothetical protein